MRHRGGAEAAVPMRAGRCCARQQGALPLGRGSRTLRCDAESSARPARRRRRAAARQTDAARAHMRWDAARSAVCAVGRAEASGHVLPGEQALPSAAQCRAEAAPMPRAARRAEPRRRCRAAAGAPADQPPPPHLRMSDMGRPPLGAAAALLSSSAPTVAAATTTQVTGAISGAARGEGSGAGRRMAAERGFPDLEAAASGCEGPARCTAAFWWLRAPGVPSPSATGRGRPRPLRCGCVAAKHRANPAAAAMHKASAQPQRMRAVLCTHKECVPEAPAAVRPPRSLRSNSTVPLVSKTYNPALLSPPTSPRTRRHRRS